MIMIIIMMMVTAVTQSIFKVGPPNLAWKYILIIDNDDDDDHNDDDNDDYSCNSVNFQARTPRFYMEVDVDHIYDMLMMMITIMMMIMMIIAVFSSSNFQILHGTRSR